MQNLDRRGFLGMLAAAGGALIGGANTEQTPGPEPTTVNQNPEAITDGTAEKEPTELNLAKQYLENLYKLHPELRAHARRLMRDPNYNGKEAEMFLMNAPLTMLREERMITGEEAHIGDRNDVGDAWEAKLRRLPTDKQEGGRLIAINCEEWITNHPATEWKYTMDYLHTACTEALKKAWALNPDEHTQDAKTFFERYLTPEFLLAISTHEVGPRYRDNDNEGNPIAEIGLFRAWLSAGRPLNCLPSQNDNSLSYGLFQMTELTHDDLRERLEAPLPAFTNCISPVDQIQAAAFLHINHAKSVIQNLTQNQTFINLWHNEETTDSDREVALATILAVFHNRPRTAREALGNTQESRHQTLADWINAFETNIENEDIRDYATHVQKLVTAFQQMRQHETYPSA